MHHTHLHMLELTGNRRCDSYLIVKPRRALKKTPKDSVAEVRHQTQVSPWKTVPSRYRR